MTKNNLYLEHKDFCLPLLGAMDTIIMDTMQVTAPISHQSSQQHLTIGFTFMQTNPQDGIVP